jgi:hypothetical protein
MHFYSYDMADPDFELGAFRLSFQIVTLENVYGLARDALTLSATASGWTLDAGQLSWAGQQQRADGRFHAKIIREGDHGLRLRITADAPHPIRAVKVLVRGLDAPRPLDQLDAPRDVPEGGLLDRYPNPLRIPVLLTALGDGRLLGARAEDPQARAKRFTVFRERMGTWRDTFTLECIHEEDARDFTPHIAVPDWVLDFTPTPDAFRDTYLRFAEGALPLTAWSQRTDVPAWLRDVRLVLTLHGMHWSGYVFNTYAQMLDTVRYAAERIDGRHLLVYLPGWEGRYYWQYGDFRPDPALGGVDGFARLCDGARALGAHIMPMVGGNCANAWAPNFHTFGPSSHMKSATRNVHHGNQPDWDLSRSSDTGWQAWLNPGAPAWQNELTRQITGLIDRFGFDAIFLDTVEVWANDPDFNMREGYQTLVRRLRSHRPDLLVTGEDWYDGLIEYFPLFQQSGHWRQVPSWVGRYARLFGHIADSEPSRGSTGVFESGYEPYQRLPVGEPYIPTLAFTDGTLAGARAEIDAVIALARSLKSCE